MLPLVFGLLGRLLGLLSTAAGTIITRIWRGRARQTALVAQDAVFNAVGAGFLFTLLLVFLAKFDKYEMHTEISYEVEPSEWNAALFIVWVSSFLVVFAKAIVIVWRPQYVQQAFAV